MSYNRSRWYGVWFVAEQDRDGGLHIEHMSTADMRYVAPIDGDRSRYGKASHGRQRQPVFVMLTQAHIDYLLEYASDNWNENQGTPTGDLTLCSKAAILEKIRSTLTPQLGKPIVMGGVEADVGIYWYPETRR